MECLNLRCLILHVYFIHTITHTHVLRGQSRKRSQCHLSSAVINNTASILCILSSSVCSARSYDGTYLKNMKSWRQTLIFSPYTVLSCCWHGVCPHCAPVTWKHVVFVETAQSKTTRSARVGKTKSWLRLRRLYYIRYSYKWGRADITWTRLSSHGANAWWRCSYVCLSVRLSPVKYVKSYVQSSTCGGRGLFVSSPIYTCFEQLWPNCYLMIHTVRQLFWNTLAKHSELPYYAPDSREGAISVAFVRPSVRPSRT